MMAGESTETGGGERKFSVKTSSPSDCKRVLSIEIPKEELEREEAVVMAELRRDLKVPGFRKGKVPLKYIEKNYAKVIHGDAVRNLLPQIYHDALVREQISPVSEPKFDNVKTEHGDNITFDVTLEVRPEIEVKGYKNIKLKMKRQDVGETQVDEALEHLRDRMATFNIVDREANGQDFLTIDYAPLLDNGDLDIKRMTRNYPVDLAGGSLLKEFREALPGMKTNEEKDIRVAYPEDFPDKEAAGTEKMFRVTLKEIKEKVLPKLDDEFAKKAGEQFEDLAALRRQIREDMLAEEDKRFKHDAEEQIIDLLIQKNSFEIPDAMVENYLSSVLEEDRKRRPQVADEAERERDVREHFREAAVRTIRKHFILEAVRKQETIEVSDVDIEARIAEIAKAQPDKADDVRQYFTHPERRRSLENELLDRKILGFLHDGADIKVP